MAVESKPLFHPEAMRQQVWAFNLPEQVAAWRPKLRGWATLIASGRAARPAPARNIILSGSPATNCPARFMLLQ